MELRMAKIRSWITVKYETSAWARLASVLAIFTINLIVDLVFFAKIDNPWLGAPLLLLWILVAASLFAWLVTARNESE